MKQPRSLARSRQKAAAPSRAPSNYVPIPLAIALSGAGVVFAILLSVYVFGTFVGTYPALARSTKSLTLVERVARHLVVNPNEAPTVATVQDPASLRENDPVFYKDAEVGDRLLVWSDKAVLYSESRDIILAVLPLRFGSLPTSPGQSTATTTTETVKIEVRNGTRKVGYAGKVVSMLKESGLFTGTFTAKDAYKKDYQETLIIKTSDKELPKATADLLNIFHVTSLSELPKAERAVNADFLIIIGANYTP